MKCKYDVQIEKESARERERDLETISSENKQLCVSYKIEHDFFNKRKKTEANKYNAI